MSKLHSNTNIINSEVKLLVIEDEEKLLSNIVDYLNLVGFNTIGFSNPLEGLTFIENNPVDVIVSDVKMPDLNGFELISAVRNSKNNKETIFIFLTAKVDRDDIREGMNLLADDYITKPFIMQDLVDAINTRLQLKYAREENSNAKPTMVKQYVFNLLDKLTKTEIKVAYLISLGKNNEQISERLSISAKTADNHRTNISVKLSISGRNKLMQVCIENRIHIKDYIQQKMRDIPHFF
jgi:DNA-binding NarL/FixJ family response regulator